MLLRIDVECFLDSPLQTVTLAIDHFHIVEIKGMLFEDCMLSSSRHVKSSVFDVGRVLLDAYTGCAFRLSNVCLLTVATLETMYNTWVRSLDCSDLSASAGATTSSFLSFQLVLHSEASRFRLKTQNSACFCSSFVKITSGRLKKASAVLHLAVTGW